MFSIIRPLLVLAITFFLLGSILPLQAHDFSLDSDVKSRLEKGEIIVGLKEIGDIKYVTGTILIDQPPEQVWPIMANPFEFQRKISPRMKEVEVVTNTADVSVLKVTLEILLIPHFTYTVESHYSNAERVEFRSVGGTLKDFKGTWEVMPANGGLNTELTYSMYVDPGIPVPQWIIREGVKGELPHILNALRKRVQAVCQHNAVPEAHTILAATVNRALPVGKPVTASVDAQAQ